jgi:hypothetical protein
MFQTYEIDASLSAPSADLISSIDMGTPTTIIVVENETSDLIIKSDLDHIKLVRNNDVLARICHANALFFVTMDPPMSLPHARNKISEITCLSSFNSDYSLDFQFVLIGNYGLDKNFLVHKMCITCENFHALVELRANNVFHMLSHFDMTSNNGIDYTSSSLIHDYFSKNVLATNWPLHFL